MVPGWRYLQSSTQQSKRIMFVHVPDRPILPIYSSHCTQPFNMESNGSLVSADLKLKINY